MVVAVFSADPGTTRVATFMVCVPSADTDTPDTVKVRPLAIPAAGELTLRSTAENSDKFPAVPDTDTASATWRGHGSHDDPSRFESFCAPQRKRCQCQHH